MSETTRANLSTLAREHYARLRALGGGEGLYVTDGAKFTLPGNDYILFASFDGFSVGWDDIRETPQGRGLRNLTTEVRTRELERAFDVFTAVAVTYFEGKPTGFTVRKHSETEVRRSFPGLGEIPVEGYSSDNYVSFRGSLSDVRRALIDARVEFDHLQILEIPRPEGPYFCGNDLTGRRQGPTNYTMKFGLTGTETEIMRYAGLLDRVLSKPK